MSGGMGPWVSILGPIWAHTVLYVSPHGTVWAFIIPASVPNCIMPLWGCAALCLHACRKVLHAERGGRSPMAGVVDVGVEERDHGFSGILWTRAMDLKYFFEFRPVSDHF